MVSDKANVRYFTNGNTSLSADLFDLEQRTLAATSASGTTPQTIPADDDDESECLD
jgi:hypothetical protein